MSRRSRGWPERRGSWREGIWESDIYETQLNLFAVMFWRITE